MLSRSISRTDAAPTARASARSRIRRARSTRIRAVRRFESSTPRIARWSGGMMTAHATTGPARGPRPTSSTPAISGPDPARRSRSIVLQRWRRRFTSALAAVRLAASRRSACLRLANARRLAREVAQVIQLRAPNAATPNDGQRPDHRAVHRENALDTDAVRDLSHREGLVDAGATTGDAHSLERLQALLVAFLHADVHPDRITGAERGNVGAEPFFLGFDEGMHMGA